MEELKSYIEKWRNDPTLRWNVDREKDWAIVQDITLGEILRLIEKFKKK